MYFFFSKPTKGYVKRQLSEKASKLRENDKKTMLVKGPHTSDLINELMNDTVSRNSWQTHLVKACHNI